MALIDAIRFRVKWQKFLSVSKWMEGNYDGRSPPEREELLKKFIRDVEDPVQIAWEKLSLQERESLLPWMFPKKEEGAKL